MSDTDRKATPIRTAGVSVAPAPELLPPRPLIAPAPWHVAITAATLVVVGTAVIAFMEPASHSNGEEVGAPARDGKGRAAEILSIATDRVPGAFRILPANFQNAPTSIVAQLHMPEADKRRLRDELADSRVRLAAVTLWDTVDEDGDAVEIAAAGFRQTLTILHKPATFFLPVVPGGAVLVKGIRDGGGGITLGISTVLGPVALPPLQVGQVVEIPAL